MWRRVSSHLHQTLIRSRSDLNLNRSISSVARRLPTTPVSPLFVYGFARKFSSDADTILSKGKKVEDAMPIATGHEREELDAIFEGRDILEINYPSGPFGTKEQPAVIKSYYDKRIVGCPGGEGEDEHDVIWFWLEKGKSHECPVCTQYFTLEVVGPGGPPEGYLEEEHHDHY